MRSHSRPARSRRICPVVSALEGRQLLNSAIPHHAHRSHAAARVAEVRHHGHQLTADPPITILSQVSFGGYNFTNFNGPNAGTNAGTGTNVNGIAGSGNAVGFDITNGGALDNFTANPTRSTSANLLNINGSTTAMALGVNSFGIIVGTDGNGNAFFLTRKGVLNTFIPLGGKSATALGINDNGVIVGQYVTSTASPGFVRTRPNTFVRVNAPSGPNVVNAQGVSSKGLLVGFYVGRDGQDHGFMANVKRPKHSVIRGIAIPDPKIPVVAGEPGATFVFSQVLAVNVHGIAVGYYGDSTTSQHGFLYNIKTGQYTFLDDPKEAFFNGVEVTQITGITNSGEITGFYSDANGVFHGFVATVATNPPPGGGGPHGGGGGGGGGGGIHYYPTVRTLGT
jgi:hypothetical protein